LGYFFELSGIKSKFKNLKTKNMKKVFSIIAIAAMTATFVACGGSHEEKAEATATDSTAAAVVDTTAAPATTDSTATAAPAATEAAPAAHGAEAGHAGH